MNAELDRVEAVFSEALARETPAERDCFLDQACGDDAALRARVDALLAAHHEGNSFLSPPDEQPTLLTESIREAPGTVIGRYKLLEQIGEGGFGVVFMAEQKEPVRRHVALKIIKLGMDTRQVIARFEAERQALAMMDHPHIAKVLDGGATPTGRPYFVMELVRGVPITEFCDANKLTPRQRLELFIPICSAIQHAHQKGIIHRDLKPGNVLVTMHDDRPVPKIIDFGVAKAINQRLTESTLFTEFRQLIGTPAYMSPEQAQMSGLDVDTRSDIYSLGVLLYELLAGATPFDAMQLRSAAYAEMQRIIREVEPPPPSTKVSTLAAGKLGALADRRRCDPSALSRTLKGELDWIVMKCLEKDRARRYETAGALARDVQRYLSDEPVEASPPSTSYRLRKLFRRHRREAIALGAILIALLLGIVGTSIGLAQARHNLALAREAEQKQASQRKQADAVATLLQSVFSHLDPYAETKGGPDLRTQIISELDKVAADLGKDSAGDSSVRARLLDSVGWTELQLGEVAKADKLLQAASDAIDTAGGPADAQAFAILRHVGNAHHLAGRTADAVELLERVLSWQTAHLGPNHPDRLATMDDLADAYGSAGRVAEQLKLYTEVRERQTETLGRDAALNATRDLASRIGRPAEAIKLLERVRDAQARQLGPDHPEVLRTIRELAVKYQEIGRADEAVRLLEDVRDQQTKKLGPDHFDVLTTVDELGLAYGAAGRHADEVALFEQMREMYVKKLGPDHPWVLTAIGNLGSAYVGVGRTAEGIRLLAQVRDLRAQRLGPEHPETLIAMDNLANAYQSAGRLGEAIRLLEHARDKQLRRLGPDHPEVMHTLGRLGHMYSEAGRPNDGIALLETVRDRMARNLGPDHLDTLVTLYDLGRAYENAARPDDAVNVFQQLREYCSRNGTAPPYMLPATFSIADYYMRRGRVREAIPLLEELRDKLTKAYGADDYRTIRILEQLAKADRSEGRLIDADIAAQRAREAVSRVVRRATNAPADSRLQVQELERRGTIFAEHGYFSLAAADYAKAIEQDLDHLDVWHYCLIPVLLQTGEIDGYRHRRSDELRRFSVLTDKDAAHRVAKDALIVPLDGEDLRLAVALADRALAADPGYWAAHQTKGMAEYRIGHYKQAIRWFLKTKDAAELAYSHELADLFLAMCYQRLGHAAQARSTLDRVVEVMQSKFPKPAEGEVIDKFPDWVFCNVIRREAEELIGGAAATRPIIAPPTTHPVTAGNAALLP